MPDAGTRLEFRPCRDAAAGIKKGLKNAPARGRVRGKEGLAPPGARLFRPFGGQELAALRLAATAAQPARPATPRLLFRKGTFFLSNKKEIRQTTAQPPLPGGKPATRPGRERNAPHGLPSGRAVPPKRRQKGRNGPAGCKKAGRRWLLRLLFITFAGTDSPSRKRRAKTGGAEILTTGVKSPTLPAVFREAGTGRPTRRTHTGGNKARARNGAGRASRAQPLLGQRPAAQAHRASPGAARAENARARPPSTCAKPARASSQPARPSTGPPHFFYPANP